MMFVSLIPHKIFDFSYFDHQPCKDACTRIKAAPPMIIF